MVFLARSACLAVVFPGFSGFCGVGFGLPLYLSLLYKGTLFFVIFPFKPL